MVASLRAQGLEVFSAGCARSDEPNRFGRAITLSVSDPGVDPSKREIARARSKETKSHRPATPPLLAQRRYCLSSLWQ